ncbi:hypothetical protein WJX77_009459 [Trebouxia sp. C0004]
MDKLVALSASAAGQNKSAAYLEQKNNLNATRNTVEQYHKGSTKAEVEKEWTGDGKLYVWSEENSVVLDNAFAECMLMDDNYMTNRQAEADPVESSSYRKILYETFPLSKLKRQFLDPAVLSYDQSRISEAALSKAG